MTQWNKQRCGGEPLGSKRSGACCCSYCEGWADAVDHLRTALIDMIALAGAAKATAISDEAEDECRRLIDNAKKLLADEGEP